ncbi:MAG: biotin/lipoyl-containing protein, partial [Actinomycetota bacterium]
MPTPVKMPQLGETVVEGTIVKWLKTEGDDVDRDEPLFEISTDKVDTEVPSPVAGKLQQIKVPEGETVSVGTELAVIEEAGGGDGQAQAEQPQPETKEPATPAGGDGQPREAEPDQARETSQPAEGERRPAPVATAERGPRSHILSPLVRRLADENRIDLN